MTPEQRRIIDQYVTTGDADGHQWADWPGRSMIEKMTAARVALRDALVAAVKSRERVDPQRALPTAEELVDLTRARVEPMVRGLFPSAEQDVMIGLLEKSVVFVTKDNIEHLIRKESFHHGAWVLANLYLASIDAELLGPDAPQLVGFSQETTCFVSPEYLGGRDTFDDFIVHEAAHVFHNWKREYAGLPFSSRKEWLLDIEFCKRETFAYSCEVFARIVEQASTAKSRLALVAHYAADPFGDERVDLQELVDILREAATARNGWRRILARCAPARKRSAPSISV